MRIHETPALLLRGAIGLAAVALVGCAPGGSTRTGRPVTQVGAFDVASYCTLAARADLIELTGSSAVVCDATDEVGDDVVPSCHVLVADTAGAISDTSLDGAIAALRAADGRFVVLTADERLVLHDGRRELRELAAWAAAPSLDATGHRVVFVAPMEGADVAELGDPTRLVSLDLASGALSVIANDESATSPLFVPDGSAVLYVAAPEGVASILRVPTSGGAPTMLTNEGLVDMGQGFVPAYGLDHAWSGDTLVYTSPSRDGRSEIWALDTTTGDASRLGEGVHPMVTDTGEVIVTDASDGRCPVTLTLSVTP